MTLSLPTYQLNFSFPFVSDHLFSRCNGLRIVSFVILNFFKFVFSQAYLFLERFNYFPSLALCSIYPLVLPPLFSKTRLPLTTSFLWTLFYLKTLENFPVLKFYFFQTSLSLFTDSLKLYVFNHHFKNFYIKV